MMCLNLECALFAVKIKKGGITMTYQISLKLKPETHQRFAHIHQQLNAGESQSLAKPLGEVLADISCEVIDQVFGDLARLSTSGDGESEKIIQHIVDTMRKYMPWSVSFFFK